MHFLKSIFICTPLSLLLVCSSSDATELSSPAAVLYDISSGSAIFEKNADEPMPAASLTKLMTALIVMNQIKSNRLNVNKYAKISANAITISKRFDNKDYRLRRNVRYTIEQLLEMALCLSSNGAAIALAEQTAGSEKAFVELMNRYAVRLGMLHTKFINASGLDAHLIAGYNGGTDNIPKESAANIMSPIDAARLSSHVISNHRYITKLCSKAAVRIRCGRNMTKEYRNTNKLLFEINNDYKVDGLKTGFTKRAGYCLIASAIYQNKRIIAIIMGAKDSDTRFAEAKILFDYAFKGMNNVAIVSSSPK